MAKSALTTAQRIRLRAEQAAAKATEPQNAAKRPKKTAQAAVSSPKPATKAATKPTGPVKTSKSGSKNPKPAAKVAPVRPVHVVTEPDSSSDRMSMRVDGGFDGPGGVLTPPWEVEFDEPVVGDPQMDAGFAGVEEPAAGRHVVDPTEEVDEEWGADPYALQKTTTPGVYVNRAGIMVDKNGVALNFNQVKDKDDERWKQILGKPVETPAELLKAVSLDPTKPLAMRIDAAKSAAPYTDRKKPVGIDGGEDGKPIMLSVKELRGLDDAQLAQMKALVALAIAAPENQE